MALHGEWSLQNENSLKRVQETGMIEEEEHQLVSVRASVMIYQVLIMQSFFRFHLGSMFIQSLCTFLDIIIVEPIFLHRMRVSAGRLLVVYLASLRSLLFANLI